MMDPAKQLEFDWCACEASAVPAPPAPAPAPEPRPHCTETDRLDFERELQVRSGALFRLEITNNRSTMMSLRPARNGNPQKLRVHHMFVGAPEAVRAALALWVRNPKNRKAAPVLDAFIREHRALVQPAQPRQVRLRTQGKHHDLAVLFAEVNAECFENAVDAAITWGAMPRVNRRRSIRFGGYFAEQGLIRMHPLLDQDFVPRHFVRYIVFHEMLHAHLGIRTNSKGRRQIHSKEFLHRERAYAGYAEALAWQSDPKNLRRLLKARHWTDRLKLFGG